MIAHVTQYWLDNLVDFDAFPGGTKLAIEEQAPVPYITLDQHELDQMTDDVPAMSAEGL